MESVDVVTTWKPEIVSALRLAGLSDEEVAACQEWAGRSLAGADEEDRLAKLTMELMPRASSLDDPEAFWRSIGLDEAELGLRFLWHVRWFRESVPEPKTAFGRAARKAADFWFQYALDHWPGVRRLYEAVKAKAVERRGKRKGAGEAEKVKLSALWRLFGMLERIRHGRGYCWPQNPEDVYEQLGDLKEQVEIDCWARDDEVLLGLMKQGRDGNGCSFCDVYSLDTFGWGWGGGAVASCPRCGSVGRSAERGLEPPVRCDGGPTIPEAGIAEYRWAVRHGMMWDEFLEVVRGQEAGFDPTKKKRCPLVDKCDTRCARDQREGVRGWPLGSSDYEVSCYKYGEIIWCRKTGLSPEQYREMKEHEMRKALSGRRSVSSKVEPKEPKQLGLL